MCCVLVQKKRKKRAYHIHITCPFFVLEEGGRGVRVDRDRGSRRRIWTTATRGEYTSRQNLIIYPHAAGSRTRTLSTHQSQSTSDWSLSSFSSFLPPPPPTHLHTCAVFYNTVLWLWLTKSMTETGFSNTTSAPRDGESATPTLTHTQLALRPTLTHTKLALRERLTSSSACQTRETPLWMARGRACPWGGARRRPAPCGRTSGCAAPPAGLRRAPVVRVAECVRVSVRVRIHCTPARTHTYILYMYMYIYIYTGLTPLLVLP